MDISGSFYFAFGGFGWVEGNHRFPTWEWGPRLLELGITHSGLAMQRYGKEFYITAKVDQFEIWYKKWREKHIS